MTTTTINKDVRMSRIGKHPRPVEDELIAKQDKAEAVQADPELLSEMIIKLHETTRTLVKKLFSCRSQEDVDKVVAFAKVQNEAFEYEWQHDSFFELRIVNAVSQIRQMIDLGIKFQDINPEKAFVKLHTIECKAVVSNWGHLTDKLIKGYCLNILR